MRCAWLLPTALLLLMPAPAPACQQLPSVYFWGGSTEINADGQAVLRGFAQQTLGGLGRVQAIRVIGHSDRTGSRAARERISLLRAQTVRDYLIASGLPGHLVSASGASDTQPLVETADNVREQLNRRVEVELTLTQPEPPKDTAAPTARSPASLC